jgi:hypothetical protein
MPCLFGPIAKPAAAARALEVQLLLFFIRMLAAVDDHAYRGGEEEYDCHNYVDDVVHETEFLVPLSDFPCNTKRGNLVSAAWVPWPSRLCIDPRPHSL